MSALPLDGIRVVDFTQAVAGPHCTLWLASLGAEVIKIETERRPDSMRLSQLRSDEGSSVNKSPLFIVTNLWKKTCGIDISNPGGSELCRDLIRESDVVIDNFKAGVMEQFGLGYEDLKAIKPGIVMASISGYGHTGAYAGFAGFAPNIHAFSGLSEVTGYLGGPAEQMFMYYADVPPGQAAALGILAALRQRVRTGEGQYVDVAMSEVLVSLVPEPLLEFGLTGRTTTRRENRDPIMAPHGCYRCEGIQQWLAVAVAGDQQWRTFADILGHPEWADDPRWADTHLRHTNEDELDATIAAAVEPANAHELAERLMAAGIAAAPSNTVKDVLENPQHQARDFLGEVDQPEMGTATLPRLPWRLSTIEQEPFVPAPLIGQNTDEVLREILGLEEDAIRELRESGAVA